MRVSVVIPCHNEALAIQKTIQRISKNVYEIIVVDNNCTDNTAVIAQSLGAKVVIETQPGYGSAIKAGLAAAQGDVLAVLDGDGQYPAERIMDFAKTQLGGKADFISGARFPLQDKNAMPFVRKFGNYLFNMAVRVLFGIKLADSQSGMWVFKRSVLEKITLESNGMQLSEEIKIKTIQSGAAFREVPIAYYPRHQESASKLSPIRHGLENVLYLLKLSISTGILKVERKLNRFFWIGLFFVLVAYVVHTFYYIASPFIYQAGLDVNVGNGFAALNWATYGPFKMMLGNYPYVLPSLSDAFGHFYTHHPSYYLFFPYVFYKVFGVSEWATRASIFALFLVSMPLLAYALHKYFKNSLFALLTVFIFTIFPGVLYYGSTLELAMFSVPASILTYSLYLLYLDTLQKKYLYLFLGSVLFGALLGWFYYFMPISIWLLFLVYNTKAKYRVVFLVGIPIILLSAVVGTIINFSIINGSYFNDLAQSFFFRTSHNLNIADWGGRVGYFTVSHYTWFFAIVSIFGVVAFVYLLRFQAWKERYVHLLPVLIAPLLLVGVLFQWFSHAFGSMFLALPIAVFSALFISLLWQLFSVYGKILAFVVLCVGVVLCLFATPNYYNQFKIAGIKDVYMMQVVSENVHDNELCVDVRLNDSMVLDSVEPFFAWYVQRNFLLFPECLKSENNITVLAVPKMLRNPDIEKELFESSTKWHLVRVGEEWEVYSR